MISKRRNRLLAVKEKYSVLPNTAKAGLDATAWWVEKAMS